MATDGNKISSPSSHKRISIRRTNEASNHQRENDDDSNDSLDSVNFRQNPTDIWCSLSEAVNGIWNPANKTSEITDDGASPRAPPRSWGMAGVYTPSWIGPADRDDAAAETQSRKSQEDDSDSTESSVSTESEDRRKSPQNSQVDDSRDSSVSTEPEDKETDTESDQKKTCNSIGFLLCILILIAAGVVVYFLTRSESTIAATSDPTSSPSSPLSSPSSQPSIPSSPLSSPSSQPSIPPSTFSPSSSPTRSFDFDPPSLEDCDRIRTGEAVAGQDLLTERTIDVILDVVMDVRATQTDALRALQNEVPRTFIPRLVGCDEEQNRRSRHQRILSTIRNRYLVGDGNVQWKIASLEKNSDCLMCFSATLHVDLFLKTPEVQFGVVANLVSDIFGDSYVESLQLERPFFTSVTVGSVINRETNWAPYGTLVAPSQKPLTAPTFAPLNPTLAPTRRPTPRPTTRAPTSRPTYSNQLVILGYNQSPSSVYPLRECAGDCDNDNDCAGGLFCCERNYFEPVPRCIGTGEIAMDYCCNPGDGFERLTFYGNEFFDFYELGQCEGDCDFDSDCEIGLICYERDKQGGDNGYVPTCVGNANIIGYGNDDYCIPRPSSNTLMSVFENEIGGNVAGGGIYPIPRCAGDCDSDADCEPGLTCYQREGFNAVPGCSGSGEEDFDYCI